MQDPTFFQTPIQDFSGPDNMNTFGMALEDIEPVDLTSSAFLDAHLSPEEVSYATSTDEDTDHFSHGSDEFINDTDTSESSETEAWLASAMNSLSMDERSKALHDIHGVSEIPPDDPEFVKQKQDSLEEELRNISSKRAYDMAEASSPDYVHDHKFRMMFLRADEFDTQKAAARMVRHFEMKLELFGPELLGKDIAMSDLSDEDIQVMHAGATQWLNQRDRAGRAVLCWTPSGHAGPVQNRLRVHFYGMMNTLRDEDTQKRGAVGIAISVGEKVSNFDPTVAMRLPRLSRALPVRFVAFHTCFDKSRARSVLHLAIKGLTTFFQVRYRSHFGTLSECLYTLMSFGIPSNALPLNPDGSVQTKQHIERLNKRRQQEIEVAKSKEKMNLVFIPGPFDVLCGRGKLSQEHMGNFRYRALISSFQEKYEKARKSEKTAIADEVIQMVKQCSGRFLSEYYADFIEISDVKAREKVSHSFRTLRIKKQQQEKNRKDGNETSGGKPPLGKKRDDISAYAGPQSIGKRSRAN